ncbi:nucleoside-diphosphate sugar epimerase [uncultured Paenibacillus sp.]|uniref:nucleoside-diphosphate sugar epimerase n=1 Tax=uncultured Paenibacillus sp. TaxID=227322 RepID=UPI0028D59FBF|nr:nucleoside-diphosphate sugar epimerase [uncultured Paenibacillus sp.]
MERLLDELVEHLSASHQQLARMLEAERQIAVRMAQVVHALPDRHPQFGGFEGLLEGAHTVGKNVVAYLHGLAELQEAMADQLTAVMKEIDDPEEE